jgi:predicted permease
VQGAALAQSAPLAGGFARSVFPEGADTTTRDRILIQVNTVTPGYFSTVGIPLVRGRDFTASDDATAPKVVVINQTMADEFWKGKDPIGKRFKFFGDDAYTSVIGVAKNSTYNGVAEQPIPFIYQPLKQNYTPAAALHVRAAGDAAALAGPVRDAVRQLDPTLTLFDVRTLEEQVGESLQPQRMSVFLLTIFGTLALLLAAIGLYGVLAGTVAQRRREIGVRMALGAGRGRVLGQVVRQGMALVAAGLLLGFAAALAATRVMASQLYGTTPHDPWIFTTVPVVLTLVAVLACWLPARRAAQVDPMVALREG